MLKVHDLRAEYKRNPIGIGVRKPRISWKLHAGDRGVMQSAYRVEVADDSAFSVQVWDSGKVQSGQSVHVELDGLEAVSRRRYYYRVMVWDDRGRQSDWSETAYWETGLLDSSQWQAAWISAPSDDERSPLLRTAFRAGTGIREARIYATALGLYEL